MALPLAAARLQDRQRQQLRQVEVLAPGSGAASGSTARIVASERFASIWYCSVPSTFHASSVR